MNKTPFPMKTTILFLFALLSQAVSAQVYNGSFEQGGQYSLSGWEAFNSTHFLNCGDLPPDSSTGFFSMKIQAHVEFPPPFSNDCYAFQRLSDVEDGQEFLVSFWTMSRPLDIGNPRVWLGKISHEGSITHVVPEVVIEAAYAPAFEWQHVVATVPWTVSLAPGDTAAIALVSENTPNANQYVGFDGVELSGSTGNMESVSFSSPTFWPNPATDKLWIELMDVPTLVTMVDVSGRSSKVSFSARSGMVEVDVTNASSGLNTLVITTVRGSRSIRFVKA